MSKVVPKDNEKFLTTFSSWDFEALIKSLPNNSIPTCVIQIESKTGNTGFLDERGQWIIAFWNKVIGEGSNIEGHRNGWTELILFAPSMESEKFIQFIVENLKATVDDRLKSLAVFSTINGSLDERINETEKMALQLNKVNYWNEHLYSSYYENGIENNLK
jgi:hypothetical protein